MEKISVQTEFLNSEDKKLLKEIEKNVFSSPKAIKYLRSIGLTDEEISKNAVKINDFVCDVKYCDKCPGFDECKKSNPHLVTKIILQNGVLDRQLQPCRKAIANMEFDNRFIINDADEAIVQKTKNNFLSDKKANDLASSSLLFAKIQSTKEYNWYYFSFLDFVSSINNCYNIAINMVNKNNTSLIYLNFPKRVKELVDLLYSKDKKNTSGDFDKKMELYCNVPVLVLEGFGDEYVNDFIRDSVISPIINARFTKRLPTLFISRYSISQLISLYSNSEIGLIRATQMIKQIKMLCEEEFTDNIED